MLEEQTRTEALRQQVAEQEQACASLKAQLNSTEERAKSSCEQLRSEMNHSKRAQDRQHERLCSVLAYLQSRDSAAGSPAEAASRVG